MALRLAGAGPDGVLGAGSGATSDDGSRAERLPSAWFDFLKRHVTARINSEKFLKQKSNLWTLRKS